MSQPDDATERPWEPGSAKLRGEERDTAPDLDPVHRPRLDELRHSERAARGLTGPHPDEGYDPFSDCQLPPVADPIDAPPDPAANA